MPMRLRLRKGDSGLTLVEVLVALAVLTIVLVAVVGLYTGGYMGVGMAGHRSDALYRAQAGLENNILIPGVDNDGLQMDDTEIEIDYPGLSIIVPGKIITVEQEAREDNPVSLTVFVPND